ncbi:MAG: zinc metallopeptidase [Sandaracinus sp.]
MFYFDPLYLVMILPALLLSMWASWATRSRFEKWSRVPARSGATGASVARYVLDQNGLSDVGIVAVPGTLSDHYDPRARVVRLSEPVYYGHSISSVAVAAHETGHAIQHARRYAPFALRSFSVPLASIGSNLGMIIIFVGFLLSFTKIVWLGILLFGGTVLFQVITLPVELDASSRAKKELDRLGLVAADERPGVASVLNAAAMTYVGAALSALSTLAYYVLRASSMGERRR